MRIAQIAPLYESVPPRLYGGTERVVSYLTEALIDLGHDVTLFASADSVTRARLCSPCARALRLGNDWTDPAIPHLLMLEQVMREARNFDVVHSHLDYLPFPLARRVPMAFITTLHGRLDLPDLGPLFQEFGDMPVVSVSHAQRRFLAAANWVATVHHGLPEDMYTLQAAPGKYLAFLGRISPEKRPDRAIEIARRTGYPLKIAAKVDRVDEEYFKVVVKPLLDDPQVEFVGEIDEKDKQGFLGNAYALLFPIEWPEPFGLVMIEAMACGTPVVAYRRGSTPEIIDHGVTGFLVDDLDSAVRTVHRVGALDRKRIREAFNQRFTARRMARDYLSAYMALREIGLPPFKVA